MKVKSPSLVKMLVVSLFLLGCNSGVKVTRKTLDTGAAKADDIVSESGDGPESRVQSANRGCSDPINAAANLAPEKTIEGTELKVTKDSKQMTLCEVLEETGRSTAIFQLVDPSCETCVKAAENVSIKLAESIYRLSIAHIIVMTSDAESAKLTEVSTFVETNLKDTIIVQDVESQLWSRLSADEKKTSIPTLASMNLNLQAEIINQENATYLDIIDEAEKLVIELNSEENTTPAARSNAPELTWNGTEYKDTAVYAIINVE